MPKIKTNRSAAKRFSFTKSGKVKHKKAFLRHLNSFQEPRPQAPSAPAGAVEQG